MFKEFDYDKNCGYCGSKLIDANGNMVCLPCREAEKIEHHLYEHGCKGCINYEFDVGDWSVGMGGYECCNEPSIGGMLSESYYFPFMNGCKRRMIKEV